MTIRDGLDFPTQLGNNLSVLFERPYVFLKQMRLRPAMRSQPQFPGPRCSPNNRNWLFLSRLVFGYSHSL